MEQMENLYHRDECIVKIDSSSVKDGRLMKNHYKYTSFVQKEQSLDNFYNYAVFNLEQPSSLIVTTTSSIRRDHSNRIEQHLEICSTFLLFCKQRILIRSEILLRVRARQSCLRGYVLPCCGLEGRWSGRQNGNPPSNPRQTSERGVSEAALHFLSLPRDSTFACTHHHHHRLLVSHLIMPVLR